MKELIINNLLSLFGVLVGAFLSKYLTTKSGKRDFLFELHKEFNNTEMSNHRSIADALILKHPDKGIQELESIDINSVTSLYVIMRYYQRLWIAVKFKQVDNKYILELFPDVFYYWYYVSFNENLLRYDWLASKQMKELADWFESNLPENIHLKYKEINQKILRERKNMTMG